MPHYQPCLLVCFLTICHAFSWGTSLSATSSGVVPTIGHAFSCGASLSAMHSGVVPHYRPIMLSHVVPHYQHCLLVVPHYRPCLLAWYLTIGLACWSVATATDIFLVECRWKKDGVPVQRWHYIRRVCWYRATLKYAFLYSATLSDMLAGFIYSDPVFVNCCSQ